MQNVCWDSNGSFLSTDVCVVYYRRALIVRALNISCHVTDFCDVSKLELGVCLAVEGYSSTAAVHECHSDGLTLTAQQHRLPVGVY